MFMLLIKKKKMLMLPREPNQHSMNKKENISLYTQMEKNMAFELKSIMTMFKITKGTYRIFSQIIKIRKKKKANSIILLLKTAYPNKNEQNQTLSKFRNSSHRSPHLEGIVKALKDESILVQCLRK